ncbi:MAG: long-chain-fatty-acid--CoA ligase [Acidilobaceae archaeon]
MEVPRRPGYSLTVDRIAKSSLARDPTREIVYRVTAGGDRIERYDYSKAFERVNALANALSALGVRRGDRIATLDWNTHWHYEAYFAVPMMGAVLHTVNVRLAPFEIEYIMNHAEDKVAIVHSDFTKLVELVAPRVKSLEAVVVVDSESVPERIGGVKAYHYEDLVKSYKGKFEWPELDENEVAGMCYTSGTTGLPKGAYFTHRMIVLHALSVALFTATSPLIGLRENSTLLHIVPMFHVFSWGLPYIATLINAKQIYPNRLAPRTLLELITRERVTHTAGVPTILYMLLADPESQKYDLSGLTFLNGGSALPRGLAEAARRRGVRVIVGYGLTETAPVLTLASPPVRLLESPELGDLVIRTGWPIPLVELQVVDPEGNPVPKDGRSMGEIVVRAPWITAEYYRDPSKTEEAWRGGWFHTGDVAVWFEDGSVLIMDRDKDVIKSGGEWISSVRLEDAISTHPGVSQVAVIAVKSRKWGERPAAIVVPKPEWKGRMTLEEVRRHLEENYVTRGLIPKWWLPDLVIEVESLPLTSVGKIAKRILRDQYKHLELD